MSFSLRTSVALLALAIPGTAFAFPIATPGTEGLLVVVTSTADIIATYEGNSADFSDSLFLENAKMFIFNNHLSAVGSTVNLGSFAVGTELLFRLNVWNGDFFTGPASRNPDGGIHARVQSNWLPGETLVSFEDLYNGPFDYNDLSFSFTNTQAAGAVPEPAAWALMIGGFALAGGMMRQRKSAVSCA